MIHQQCPHCGQGLTLDEQRYKAGSTVIRQCPRCGSNVKFTITESTSDNPWVRILLSPLITVGACIIGAGIGAGIGVRSEEIGGLYGGIGGFYFGLLFQMGIKHVILYAVDKNRRNKEALISIIMANWPWVMNIFLFIIIKCARGMGEVASVIIAIIIVVVPLIILALLDIYSDDDSW